MSQQFIGASAPDGSGAVETRSYAYTYGNYGVSPRNYTQLLYTETEPSVLGAPSKVTTYVYAKIGAATETSTNRLAAVFRSGNTEYYDATSNNWSVDAGTVGTFYFTSQPCSHGADDPLGRVVEVHGPCRTSGVTAIDCNPGTVPVTQYQYYAADGTADSNRLRSVTKYANASATTCAGGLTTTFANYTSLGDPQTVTDPNGVVTKYTYEEHRIASITIAYGTPDAATTNYHYQNGKLIWIQHPKGNFEVYCYQTGTTSSCTGGNWSERLQWKAKASDSLGSNWTEKETYTYWPDGTVATQSDYSSLSPNSPRRTTYSQADSHRRPVFERRGTASQPFAARLFDGADNLTGMGLPFNNPTAVCGGAGADGGPLSSLCSVLQYDTANRPVSVDLGLQTADSTRECISYDPQGNVSQVQTGCGAGTACSSCTAPATTYQYDDFGNVVSVHAPWLGTDSTGFGSSNMAYDALGNLIARQIPGDSEASLWAYDGLGRETQKSLVTSRGPTSLYNLYYDGTTTPDPGCSVANSAGRLQMRLDSFGETWFAYDRRGNILSESRERGGVAGADGGVLGCTDPTSTSPSLNTHNTPNTSYVYDLNDNVVQTVYPYGRKVTTSYGTGGNADRITSIAVAWWSTVWNAPDVPQLSNITWEPYAGLRAYQANWNGAPRFWVENVLGSNTVSPTSCSALPYPAGGGANDQTGRIHGVWVSDGGISLGNPNSNPIFAQDYSYTGDLLTTESTCVANQGPPITDQFDYDRLERLKSHSTTWANGEVSSRTFGYTGRSVLSTLSEEGSTVTVMRDAVRADRLLGLKWGMASTQLARNFSYDTRGHAYLRTSESYGYSSTAYATSLNVGYGVTGYGSDEDTVAQANLNGSLYYYYYDARNRRRLKAYPGTRTDEYFYDDHNDFMLVDQGNDSTSGTVNYYVLDEYVWLDGRPVFWDRSRFSPTWARQTETTLETSCSRVGDGSSCGYFWPVTDYLGKPVAVLDNVARILGTGNYDSYGFVNRRQKDDESPHPYSSSSTVESISPYIVPGMTASARVHWDLVDTRYASASGGCAGGNDWVKLQDSSSTPNVYYSWSGTNSFWTGWVVPTTWPLNTRLEDNCILVSSLRACTCQLQSSTAKGAIVSGYEIQQYTTGTRPQWPPFTFPGQYYDQELELSQNWNRWYDPQRSAYLEPDPLLTKSPNAALAAVSAGQSLPVFSYADDNPVNNVDPDGNVWFNQPGCSYISTKTDALDQAKKIKDPAIEACVENRIWDQTFHLDCNSDDLRCAHGNTGDSEVGPTSEKIRLLWCNRKLSAKCQAVALVHELAHSCGDTKCDTDGRGKSKGEPFASERGVPTDVDISACETKYP